MLGTTLNQRFLLDKELGRGGMGAVYRATDLVLQRTVAIKVLKELTGDEIGRRICLEAQILARLLHENIVRLYDFNKDGGTYYFIMEEVDGTSFQKRWKKIGLPERVQIIAQVADALDYAHHQGVIHRDVKPANVLLTSRDQAKLSDFGLSVTSDAAQESGVVRGTPHYMSPEQAKGRKIDFRSDLYSVGVMLYECATGSTPYAGSLMSIMSQHVNSSPELPRSRNAELSIEFERLILRLMSKAPDVRPDSGRELAQMLRDLYARGLLAGGGSSTTTAVSPVGSSNGRATGDSRPTMQAPSISPATAIGPVPSSGSGQMPAGTLASGSGQMLSGSSASSGTLAPPSRSRGSLSRSSAASVRDLFEIVEREPIAITPDERYLCGHYLAYLLGGSRRRGFTMRRPLDPLNADRARLMLGMTALIVGKEGEVGVGRVASMLDQQPDVRPALSPVVVMKYLASRDTPAKRKRFRQVRQALQQASPYATKAMTDEQGVLNPGLMPQVIDDLRRLAPERTEVDDQLVQRWNRVTEVWRSTPDFRDAVLRYATRSAFRDAASADLWPEVVYPLIERARWQRRLRPAMERVWDTICQPLHIPDAGLRLDRAIRQSVPEPVIANLDLALDAFEENPSLSEPDQEAASDPGAKPAPTHSRVNAASFEDIEAEPETRSLVRLAVADPQRFNMGELRTLWQEALAALRAADAKAGHRHVPVGAYRLSVVASIRSRSAGQIAIQGMPNKQVEMLVPSFTGGGSASRPILAVWSYTNHSLAITYTDHLGTQRYICWDASTAQQSNFDDPAKFNHHLFVLGLEVPDQLDRALSKSFRPKNRV